MYRLITFDIVGTLLHFSVSPGKVYTKSASKFGIAVEEKLVSSNFKKRFKEMSKNHPNFGQETGIGWETWWHDLVVGILRDSASCDQQDEQTFSRIAKDLIAIYRRKDCYNLAEGAVDLLTELKQTDVKMGVISNYDERIHSVLKSIKLHSYFDFVISSYEAGAEKPSPEIFKKAMKAACHQGMGIDCIHVGDRVDTDCLGALGAGWSPALIASDCDDIAEAHRSGVPPSLIFPNLPKFKSYIMCNICKQ